MKKRINIATIVDKMQRATRHLVELCSHNIRYSLLLAVANSSLFTLHSSLLMGCSSDDETAPEMTSLEVNGYVSGFEEANGITRGWIPPSDYSIDEILADMPISVFFAREQKDGESDNDYKENMEEEFFYKSSDKWRVSKKNLEATSYYLYGYIPHEDFVEPKIEHLTGAGKTYADGAVLTLEQLNTVMGYDLCVIIGAKNGKDDYKADPTDYSVTGLKRGDFRYEARTTGTGGTGGNYVYLLFDHLYAAMRFNIRVHRDYNALRTIKLKELSLQAFTGDTPTKKKMKAVITIEANASGDNPLTNIVFTPSGTETGTGTFYTNEDGEELNTDYKTFQGSFMPDAVTKVNLTTTYDVYDLNNNLIRKDCKATNTLDITKLFLGQTSAKRGHRYTINLTVQPTYLYMLSEPDLDNPTVKVE